jgi:hypothetical protein
LNGVRCSRRGASHLFRSPISDLRSPTDTIVVNTHEGSGHCLTDIAFCFHPEAAKIREWDFKLSRLREEKDVRGRVAVRPLTAKQTRQFCSPPPFRERKTPAGGSSWRTILLGDFALQHHPKHKHQHQPRRPTVVRGYNSTRGTSLCGRTISLASPPPAS